MHHLKSFLSNYPHIYGVLEYFSKYYFLLFRKIDRLRAKIEFYLGSRPRIDPLKLYWVDPDKIKYSSNKSPDSFFRLSPVAGGSWDKNIDKLSKMEIIYCIDNHFNEDKDWQRTKFFKRAKKCIENQDKEWNGRTNPDSMEEFKSYLGRIDLLYRKITEEGYKTQRELSEERWGFSARQAIERHEVTVNIGRNGEILLERGWHRLSISKAIGLETIPVRIASRHSKWQERRKKSLNSNKSEELNHPDLINLHLL